jgi:hypothetical protein
MKKNLITIFTFCPDFERKKILQDLINSLQSKRESYDILVVSHSPISDLSLDMVDFFYYDKENPLLKDFDTTNRFWFRGDNIMVNTSLVYPFSTHLTIYRLMYFTMNFAKFMGYKKTHYFEYDIKLDNIELIDEINSKLDEVDNIMFKEDDGWIWGMYFATNNETLNLSDFSYDEKKIIEDLKSIENRMSEYVTPLLITRNGRNIHYYNIDKIDKEKICKKVDKHFNNETNWCVPIVEEDKDFLSFFIYNEKGLTSDIDVFVDGFYYGFKTPSKGTWTLNNIGYLSQVYKVEIFVDKILRNKILFDESNREDFRKNNFYRYF